MRYLLPLLALACTEPVGDSGNAVPFVQPGLDDPTARQWTRAGDWYPEDPDELDREVESMLRAVDQQPRPVRVLLTPHAGLSYSGPMAAQAWARARVPDTVVILAPNHWQDGVDRALWAEGPWLVPGHAIGVEDSLVQRLFELAPDLEPDRDAFLHHEAEMQLPFLQKKSPSARIVVVGLRDNQDWDFKNISLDEIRALGRAVATLIEEREAEGDEVLLVITTDLVHYVPETQAQEEDPVLLAHIEALDVEGLYDSVKEENLSICGEVPTAVGMVALQEMGIEGFDFVDRNTSLHRTGDDSSVVGYPAGVVYR